MPPPLHSPNVFAYTDTLEMLATKHQLDVLLTLVKMEEAVLDSMELEPLKSTVCAHTLGSDNTANGTQLLTTLLPPKLQDCSLSLLLFSLLLFK